VGQGQGDALNRVADVLVAGTGLVLASPFLALAMLATKLEGGGPVFYRQTRVGRDGEDFEVLKLRSMVVGAENLGAGYAVDEGDARITRVGRVLRRTSIDELPQLWNVVRGDMSMIGPRPTLRYQVEQYDEDQRRRLEEDKQIDACFFVENDGRYRGNLFIDRKGMNGVFRVIRASPLSTA